jgi:Metallo-beta-lactamase superfamily
MPYKPQDVIVAQRHQHPVGHGGFHTATVHLPNKKLHYVFDCGSIQRNALCRQIADYGQNPSAIDVLFVSHFHKDHINGLDTFLAIAGPVENAVIPYLEPEDRAFIVLAEMSAGRLSKLLADFVSDPEDWFRSRGVQNVFRLRPGGGSGDPPQPPPEPLLPGGESAATEGVSIRIVNGDGSAPAKATHVNPIHANNTFDINPGAHVCSQQGSKVLDWLLLPRSARIMDSQTILAFGEQLKKLIGLDIRSPSFADELIKFLKSGNAAKIGPLYELIAPWRDHNVVSLSLYSGVWPLPERNNPPSLGPFFTDPYRRTSEGYDFATHGWTVGWLLTGDAKLGKPTGHFAQTGQVVDDWWGFYNDVLAFTRTLMLPHHGSAANLPLDEPTLMGRLKGLNLYATAKSNAKKHPAKKVRLYFPDLLVVTENEADEMIEWVVRRTR